MDEQQNIPNQNLNPHRNKDILMWAVFLVALVIAGSVIAYFALNTEKVEESGEFEEVGELEVDEINEVDVATSTEEVDVSLMEEEVKEVDDNELNGEEVVEILEEEEDFVWHTRNDPTINLSTINSFANPSEAVVISGSTFTATSQPQEGGTWVNFQIETDKVTNFVSFDIEFTSEEGAKGLVSLYVNDSESRGIVDEPYTLPGTRKYAMPTPGELEPGEHIVSFRLDNHGEILSSVKISNVATGWGGFVKASSLDN